MNALEMKKECRCHKFIVGQVHLEKTAFKLMLPCTCGASHEYAAILPKRLLRMKKSWSNLNEDGRYEEWEKNEVLNSLTKSEKAPNIKCYECFKNATDSDWEKEEFEPKIFGETEYFVRCDKCEQYVEFGFLRGGGKAELSKQ